MLFLFLIASTQIQGKAKLSEYMNIDFFKMLILFIVFSLSLTKAAIDLQPFKAVGGKKI